MGLEDFIQVSKGAKPADLLIRNAWVVDVLSGELIATDVAVYHGRVAGLGSYDANSFIDLGGRHLCPGFIDAHLHIESTMLTPPEFARVVSPHGTTAVVCDPHEIANVLGAEGVNYMLKSSAGLPVTVYVMLPSSVPATRMETSGAELTSGDLSLMINQERVLGIAEMMNYPGVLAGDHEVLNKIRVAAGKRVDGHAPGLTGKELCAYIGSGIHSDHECVLADEAREKLGLGMHIMVREGTTAKNLRQLVKIVNAKNSRRFMFCTDDRSPGDLIDKGHIDHSIRMAVAEGIDPVTAIQMATINPARYFGLRDVGAIAPGYKADFAVLEDLEGIEVKEVIKDGHVVAREGSMLRFESESPERVIRSTVNIKDLSIDKLKVKGNGSRVLVIGIIPDQIVTEKLVADPEVDNGGLLVSDPRRDILKIAVFERHLATGNVGLGFIKGMGLKRGAVATSVAHDSHNVITVGANDRDMVEAVSQVARMGGGAAVAVDGKISARLPLPVAGLISDQPAAKVAEAVQQLTGVLHELGCRLENPLITLSFMALPVIPELKISDRGLIDVSAFKLTGLFETKAKAGKEPGR